eukprot:TRINITY_DN7810_c0_g1_i1.p1 TRINITY_DN7810_c0_g1~~TRINITY_DN7810_c0_g1_i1.p1  ORF type:complete len:677 (+),score=134.54 TRINITY_DN7810_c0_g1_i1:402-2432(+)
MEDPVEYGFSAEDLEHESAKPGLTHGVDPLAAPAVETLVDVPPEKFPYFDGPEHAVTTHTVKSAHQRTFKRKQASLSEEEKGAPVWEELDDALHAHGKTEVKRVARKSQGLVKLQDGILPGAEDVLIEDIEDTPEGHDVLAHTAVSRHAKTFKRQQSEHLDQRSDYTYKELDDALKHGRGLLKPINGDNADKQPETVPEVAEAEEPTNEPVEEAQIEESAPAEEARIEETAFEAEPATPSESPAPAAIVQTVQIKRKSHEYQEIEEGDSNVVAVSLFLDGAPGGSSEDGPSKLASASTSHTALVVDEKIKDDEEGEVASMTRARRCCWLWLIPILLAAILLPIFLLGDDDGNTPIPPVLVVPPPAVVVPPPVVVVPPTTAAPPTSCPVCNVSCDGKPNATDYCTFRNRSWDGKKEADCEYFDPFGGPMRRSSSVSPQVLPCGIPHDVQVLRIAGMVDVTTLADTEFACLTQLEELVITDTGIKSIDNETFTGLQCTNLSDLYVEDTPVEYVGPIINSLTRLTSLFFNRVEIHNTTEIVWSSFPDLNYLQLSYANLDAATNVSFGGLNKLLKLEHIGLNDNYIENISNVFPPGLRNLDLSWNWFPLVPKGLLSTLPNTTSLRLNDVNFDCCDPTTHAELASVVDQISSRWSKPECSEPGGFSLIAFADFYPATNCTA